MPNIETYLAKIREAVYGEEVRGSIHDAIQAINNEVVNSDQVHLRNSITSNYSSSSAYAVGDYVFYPNDGVLYRCKIAIPYPGEEWNSSHWIAVNLGADVIDIKEAISTKKKGEAVATLTRGDLSRTHFENGELKTFISSTHSCTYFAPHEIRKIQFQKLSSSYAVVCLKAGSVIRYIGGEVGNYDLDIYDEEVYINFFGSEYVTSFTIYPISYQESKVVTRNAAMASRPLTITAGDYNGHYYYNNTMQYGYGTSTPNYSFVHFNPGELRKVTFDSKGSGASQAITAIKPNGTYRTYGVDIECYNSFLIEEDEEVFINFYGSEYYDSMTLYSPSCVNAEDYREYKALKTIGVALKHGDESQYYFNGTTKTYAKNWPYSVKHYDKGHGIERISFTKYDSSLSVVFTIDPEGNVTSYGSGTGTFDFRVNQNDEIWINFFGSDYSSDINIYGFVESEGGSGKKDYEPGFIHFTVDINSTPVDTSSTADALTDSEVMKSVDCILTLPATYTPSGLPCRLLMMCHGAGRGTIGNSNWTTIPSYQAMVNKFVNAGYAVFDCHGYGSNANECNLWGSPIGVNVWRKAYDYIVRNYNVEENISIYGFSMGGLTAMNLALNNFPNIKCIALASPVLDLTKCWEDSSVHDTMVNSYGRSDWANIEPGNNPYSNVYTENNTLYFRKQLPPIKIWYGATETGSQMAYVDKSLAANLVTAIRNSGGTAWYREVSDHGHEVCYGAVDYCNTEFLYWFNRFNK